MTPQPATVERLVIALPCGHLVDNNPTTTFTLHCTHCDRSWTAHRKSGVLELTAQTHP